jgi:hypothetical protein
MSLLLKENNPLIQHQPKFMFYHDTSFILRIFKKVDGFNLHNSIYIVNLVLVEITPSLYTEGSQKPVETNRIII